jgi:hypothetical protein
MGREIINLYTDTKPNGRSPSAKAGIRVKLWKN